MTTQTPNLKNFEDAITSLLSTAVKQFIVKVAATHPVATEEKLVDLWNLNYGDSEFKVACGKKAASSAATSADPNSSGGCCYVFKKGNEKGQTCKQKLDPSSTNFCKKHLKHDGTVQVPAATGDAPAASTSGFIAPVAKVASKMKISKNSYGNYEHDETHFIFSRETSKVIGKQEGDKVVPLTDADMELMKKYNFSS